MTDIVGSCPDCGECHLTAPDITLMVCDHAPLSYYEFTCPNCHDVVRKPADEHAISLLMSGGVKATMWEVPAEALEPRHGPAIDHDDLLDLVLAMNDGDMLAPTALAELTEARR